MESLHEVFQIGLFRTVRRFVHLLQILGVWQSIVFMKQWISGKPMIQFKALGVPTKMYCRRNSTDIKVLWEIFGSREISVGFNEPPSLIIDGGAYVGYSTLYLANRFPSAKIIAIEPSSINLEMLEKNCCDYANIQIVHGAIWDQSEKLVLFNPSGGEWGFQVGSGISGAVEEVDGITINELMKEAALAHIDLLKLDIEGAEERLFAAEPENWLGAVQSVLIEIHSASGRQQITQIMKANGFLMSRSGEKYLFSRNHVNT